MRVCECVRGCVLEVCVHEGVCMSMCVCEGVCEELRGDTRVRVCVLNGVYMGV